MAGKNKKWKNPFYALLIPSGALFCVTAFAYGFMAFQQVNAGRSTAMQHVEHPMHVWLNTHGTKAILIELAVLAVLTVGAIATDGWWVDDTKDSETADKRG